MDKTLFHSLVCYQLIGFSATPFSSGMGENHESVWFPFSKTRPLRWLRSGIIDTNPKRTGPWQFWLEYVSQRHLKPTCRATEMQTHFSSFFCLTSIIHPDFCSCSFTKAPNKIKVWKLLSRAKTCRNWCSMSVLSFFEHFSLHLLERRPFWLCGWFFVKRLRVETDNDWIFWNTGNHIPFYSQSGSGSLTTREWSIFFKWTTKAAMLRVLLNRPIKGSICSVLNTLLYIPVITFVTSRWGIHSF